MQKTYLLIVAALVVLAGSWWYYTSLNIDVAKNPQATFKPTAGHEESPPEPVTTPKDQGASSSGDNEAEFTCDGGKTIIAIFTRDIVGLTLSDGRQITLRQAESASGIRYLNNTQTIEFRGKGDEAYLEESGKMTYGGCKAT